MCKLKSVLNRGSCGPSSGGGCWQDQARRYFYCQSVQSDQVPKCQWQYANLIWILDDANFISYILLFSNQYLLYKHHSYKAAVLQLRSFSYLQFIENLLNFTAINTFFP